ncbi:unnamed protein product, partial [marine sediment metagenome]
VPVSAVGCGGDMVQVTLTVYPGPVLDPDLDATVCSEEAGGIVLDIAAGSIAVTNYNITNINVANGLVAYIGNATAGNGKPANEIESDKFTNTSSTAKTVVYDIVPVGTTGCKGDMVQVTLTVNPEPVIDPGLNTTTCSDVAGGIILDVASGSVAAAGYNITSIAVNPSLVAGPGNATTGNGLSSNAIAGDKFTNATAGPLTVVYDVAPVSADGCTGDVVQITLTVNPEPILDPGINSTTCSDATGGITLKVAGGSVTAANYNIT